MGPMAGWMVAFCYVHPENWGRVSPHFESDHIFQVGWFNHQRAGIDFFFGLVQFPWRPKTRVNFTRDAGNQRTAPEAQSHPGEASIDLVILPEAFFFSNDTWFAWEKTPF